MINPLFAKWIEPHRYKIAFGGRGSSKSFSIAMMLIEISRRTKVRILCTRELQISISDSVLQLLSDTIERGGYQDEFTVQRNVIYHTGGSVFLFYGLKTNTTKIKSLEGIDIVWAEEAENISRDSWEILIPTIRKEFSEIWVSFNPANILDNTYQRFVVNPPKDSISMQVNYNQNPWFPDVLRDEMEFLKAHDYDMYLNIWEGQPIADTENAFIKPSWISACIDAHNKIECFNNNYGRSVIAFDVADEGADSNAMTFMQGSMIHWTEEWNYGDTGESTRRVFSRALTEQATVVYDAIGVGAGAKAESNRLNKDTDRQVMFTPFIAGGAVENPDNFVPGLNRDNKDFFANAKAQLWWMARDRIYNTYLAVTTDKKFDISEVISLNSENPLLEKLCAELSQPKIDYDNNSRVKVESKKDLAKRDIKSPNLADSFVMCFYPDDLGIYIG